MSPRRLIAAAVALLALAAATPSAAEPALVATGFSAPAPPPGVQTMAIYGSLANAGDAPLTVTGIEAAGFASAMIHETVTTNGVVTMRHRMSLPIAPGETVVFAPGGFHIMLMGPTAPVPAGATISGVFRMEDGSAVTFEASVTAPGTMDMRKGHGGMSHGTDGST